MASSSSSPSPAAKPTVLVAGGGYGGLRVVKELQGDAFDVVLVDPKEFFECTHSPAMMVDPRRCERYLIPFPPSIPRKQDALVSLSSDGTRGQAKLRSGEEVAFDYAVLALGSAYSPFKPGSQAWSAASRKRHFQTLRDQLDRAAHVVVVGGGNVGVELAAEIACCADWGAAARQKRVTLVAGPVDRLLPRMDPRASDYALGFLTKQGVDVLLEDSLTDWGPLATSAVATDISLTTRKGRALQADVSIQATGPRAGAAALGGLAPEQLTPGGQLRVGETLQVEGWPNVLAIGDCANLPWERTANAADLEGLVAAANIKALASAKPLLTYPAGLFGAAGPVPLMAGCGLGQRAGIFQAGRGVQTGAGPAFVRAALDRVFPWYISGAWLRYRIYPMMKKAVVAMAGREMRHAAAAAEQRPAAA